VVRRHNFVGYSLARGKFPSGKEGPLPLNAFWKLFPARQPTKQSYATGENKEQRAAEKERTYIAY